MIKDLKLIKYGYQFKLNAICSFVFMLIGILSVIYINIDEVPSISVLIYCSFLFFAQTASTLMYSNVIKSSPKYKEFCIMFQRIINILLFIFSFGVLFIIRFIQADSISQFNAEAGKEVAAAGIEYFIMVLYILFVYKFFIVSMIMFCTVTLFFNSIINYIPVPYNFTLLHGIGVAVLLFIITMVLSEILIRAMYKIQPSRLAQSASLRGYI
ncbi:MAG: hypothetical protein HFH67_10775 [Lachnospiraceae bacterium]|nr:hypothetical protein [Lachnospiraceae bacterium]